MSGPQLLKGLIADGLGGDRRRRARKLPRPVVTDFLRKGKPKVATRIGWKALREHKPFLGDGILNKVSKGGVALGHGAPSYG